MQWILKKLCLRNSSSKKEILVRFFSLLSRGKWHAQKLLMA